VSDTGEAGAPAVNQERLAASEALRAHLGTAVPGAEAVVRPDGELDVRVRAADLEAAARVLAGRAPHPLNYLACVTGLDWPERGRLEVVYTLYSLPGPAKVHLRVEVDRSLERPSVPSLTSVWPTAEFQEREVFDLLGVWFEGHPDLRRILLKEDFEGHPLRKDFVDRRPPWRRVTREDYQP
jgi:NADH-quinone oxidoreductase subunit C